MKMAILHSIPNAAPLVLLAILLSSCAGTEEQGLPQTFQVASFGSLPRWSPDGQKLAFGAEGTQAGIWVYYRGSGAVEQIVDAAYPHLYDYRWSPGSDQLAFGGAGASIDNTSGIFTVSLDGAVVRRHPTGRSPDWDPSGGALVFAEDDPETGAAGIYRLELAGSTLTPLTSSGSDPLYSPTGEWIAFRQPITLPGVLHYQLAIIPESGDPVKVVADSCQQFLWTPDGESLVYDYLLGSMILFRVPLPGTSYVDMPDSVFVPNYLSAPLGTTVTWRNLDDEQHTVTSTSGLFNSGLLSPGENFSYVFNALGNQNYGCILHPTMTGVVQVQSNGDVVVNGGIDPTLSQAGRMAYQAVNGDLSAGIFTVNLDGSDMQPLSEWGFQPAFSPDGASVAFAGDDGIWMVNP